MLGHHLPDLFVERQQPFSDQGGLETGSGWGFLLEIFSTSTACHY
jgi:hypothetical protein